MELRGFVLVLKESQCCAIGIGLRIDFKACFISFFVRQGLLQLCRVYREGRFLLGDPVVLATIFRHRNRNGQRLPDTADDSTELSNTGDKHDEPEPDDPVSASLESGPWNLIHGRHGRLTAGYGVAS